MHPRREITEVNQDIQHLQDTAAAIATAQDGRPNDKGKATSVNEADREAIQKRRHADRRATGQHPGSRRHRTEKGKGKKKGLPGRCHIATHRKETQARNIHHGGHQKIRRLNAKSFLQSGGKIIVKPANKSRKSFRKWRTTKNKFRGFDHHQLTFTTEERTEMSLNPRRDSMLYARCLTMNC